MRRATLVWTFRIGLLLLLLAGWEYAVERQWLAVYLYGRPSGIVAKAGDLIANGTLASNALITSWETVLGFLIGTLAGSLIGLMLWLSPLFADVVRPYLIALNGLPKIALAPLIIVWFGTGLQSKVAIAAIITFIVAVISALGGANQVDVDLLKLMRSLGASRLQAWRLVVVPASLPWIISAFRLNIGFALIGAVVGEYIASKDGLGYMIYYAGVLYDLNSVWVGIITLMLVALIMYAAVNLAERLVRY